MRIKIRNYFTLLILTLTVSCQKAEDMFTHPWEPLDSVYIIRISEFDSLYYYYLGSSIDPHTSRSFWKVDSARRVKDDQIMFYWPEDSALMYSRFVDSAR